MGQISGKDGGTAKRDAVDTYGMDLRLHPHVKSFKAIYHTNTGSSLHYMDRTVNPEKKGRADGPNVLNPDNPQHHVHGYFVQPNVEKLVRDPFYLEDLHKNRATKSALGAPTPLMYVRAPGASRTLFYVKERPWDRNRVAALLKLQSMIRAFIRRVRYKRYRRAVTILQAHLRRRIVERDFRKMMLDNFEVVMERRERRRQYLIVRMQCRVRGWQARRRFLRRRDAERARVRREKKLALRKGIIRIQSLVRGWLVRLRLKRVREAVLLEMDDELAAAEAEIRRMEAELASSAATSDSDADLSDVESTPQAGSKHVGAAESWGWKGGESSVDLLSGGQGFSIGDDESTSSAGRKKPKRKLGRNLGQIPTTGAPDEKTPRTKLRQVFEGEEARLQAEIEELERQLNAEDSDSD